MTEIMMPRGASVIIDTLMDSGYDAYIVGGCVRDSLLGLVPKDWDICTSATPIEVESCLSEYRILETGLKHGTVTILMDDGQYEVTTFREDGKYSDNRRPDSVKFVTDIMFDLSRRDFTINAMTYNGAVGLVDPYNGEKCLKDGIISCVGMAEDRFQEDALRIMRAIRFASVYGFTISEDTAKAIHSNCNLLNNIAVERINSELCKLIVGRGALNILLDYDDVITTVIPELKPCVGFSKNDGHSLYEHMARAVSSYDGDDLIVKIALLLHDIGKPSCSPEDEPDVHLYGHEQLGSDIAANVVSRMRFDRNTQRQVVELIRLQDEAIEPTEKDVCRWLSRIGTKQLFRLLDVNLSNAIAHAEEDNCSITEQYHSIKEIAEEIIASGQCYKIEDLAINGFDIISAGIPEGAQVGNMLQSILSLVIDGSLDNKRDILLEYIRTKTENNIS